MCTCMNLWRGLLNSLTASVRHLLVAHLVLTCCSWTSGVCSALLCSVQHAKRLYHCACECCKALLFSWQIQCRCHPEISRVSNALYYNSHLIDGCTAAQRPPLLPGLSAVCFVEVRGQQQYGHGSSSASNRAEAQAVVQARLQPRSQASSCASLHVVRAT